MVLLDGGEEVWVVAGDVVGVAQHGRLVRFEDRPIDQLVAEPRPVANPHMLADFKDVTRHALRERARRSNADVAGVEILELEANQLRGQLEP